VLRKIEAQEKHEAAKRLRSTASTVFRFGIAIGACRRDPAADLKGALTAVKSTPHAAITEPADVGELLRAIDSYSEKPALRLALQLLALTFVRPGMICNALWSEFDLDAGVWSIPGAKMKMRDAFRVPLSRQALAVLKELHAITGNSRYLLPLRKGGKPLFTYRLNVALRELGYASTEAQAHGFRSTASTLLNEHSEFSPDVIELSLAHTPSGVRAIYNRSKYWTERCALMQWYADYLDDLRGRGKVVALPRKTSRSKTP
jgi:integrase